MKTVTRVFCAAVCALALLWAAALTAPAAHAEPAYQDGDYTVAFSMDGLGRHNVAWDTATVHVKGGALYVDFTLERVDPRKHAPQYDWLTTPCGKFYPTLDDATFTCTFFNVQVPNLGAVAVVAYSAPMATEIEYVLHIDDSAIPVVSDAPTQQEPQPAQPEQPVSQAEQPATQPEDQSAEAPDGGKDAAQPADGEGVVTTTGVPEEDVPKDAEDTVETTGVLSGAPGAEDDSGLPALGIVGIAAGAAVIIGGGAYLIARAGKGKRDEK